MNKAAKKITQISGTTTLNYDVTAGLTPDSLALFDSLCKDSGNWNGFPLVTVTKETRGNLTQLKKAKLLETVREDKAVFAMFTDAGKQLATERGNPIEGLLS